MAIYAFGDVQGCYDPLMRLLDLIQYDQSQDQLWFTGDLINRGPMSLEVLRFVKSLPNAVTVLGNHDLHLLAVASGAQSKKPLDTLDRILTAPDCEDLCQWLRRQPLLHYDSSLGYTMVHAGIAPPWSLQEAQSYARELENALNQDNYKELLENLYGNDPSHWNPELTGFPRLRLISNYFTRMRFCTLDGTLNLSHKGAVGSQDKGFYPWFEIPNRPTKNNKIIFGHWAALGGIATVPNVYPLDTGCVWGNKLTALRLSDEQYFSVPA